MTTTLEALTKLLTDFSERGENLTERKFAQYLLLVIEDLETKQGEELATFFCNEEEKQDDVRAELYAIQ